MISLLTNLSSPSKMTTGVELWKWVLKAFGTISLIYFPM